MDANARFTRCIYEWERKVLRLIGHDFLDGEFKPNAITVIVYVLIVLALAGIINTIIYYDVPDKLFCVLCLILVIQVRSNKTEIGVDPRWSLAHRFVSTIHNLSLPSSEPV